MGNAVFRGLTAPKTFDGFSKKFAQLIVSNPTRHAKVGVNRFKGGVSAHARLFSLF